MDIGTLPAPASSAMDRAKAAEEDYFRREEADKLSEEAQVKSRDAERASQVARDRAAALEVRRCPRCRTALGNASLREVEVQRCLSCGGVWLEAGALELLTRRGPGWLERVRGLFGGRRSAPPP